MQKQQLLKLLSISLLLTACGSTSSNSNSADNKVGYLIDSAVQGVEYRCGTKIGITASDGKFICPNLPATFYIGSIKLGSIEVLPSDNKVFPQDIIGVSREKVENEAVVKLATLLQSLDNDGNASNGIKITSEIRSNFERETEIPLKEVHLGELEELYPNIKFIDREAVITHLSFSVGNFTIDDGNSTNNNSATDDDNITNNNSTTDDDNITNNNSTTDENSTTTNNNSATDNGSSIANEVQQDIKIPDNYSHRVINNQGIAVEGSINNYTIRIYSNSKEVANSQSRHQGVVVKINGEASENIAIQASYINKTIIVAVYDATGKIVKISDEIVVTDVPVVIVELNV